MLINGCFVVEITLLRISVQSVKRGLWVGGILSSDGGYLAVVSFISKSLDTEDRQYD